MNQKKMDEDKAESARIEQARLDASAAQSQAAIDAANPVKRYEEAVGYVDRTAPGLKESDPLQYQSMIEDVMGKPRESAWEKTYGLKAQADLAGITDPAEIREFVTKTGRYAPGADVAGLRATSARTSPASGLEPRLAPPRLGPTPTWPRKTLSSRRPRTLTSWPTGPSSIGPSRPPSWPPRACTGPTNQETKSTVPCLGRTTSSPECRRLLSGGRPRTCSMFRYLLSSSPRSAPSLTTPWRSSLVDRTSSSRSMARTKLSTFPTGRRSPMSTDSTTK
ncbi:MAG: hypothetical protein MZV70_54355 [Desulfobacterales bacterium]|nr:hypothetical protein [Desulfobacterales bacterium]